MSLETCLNSTLAGSDNVILTFHSSAVAVKHQSGLYYVFDSHNSMGDFTLRKRVSEYYGA